MGLSFLKIIVDKLRFYLHDKRNIKHLILMCVFYVLTQHLWFSNIVRPEMFPEPGSSRRDRVLFVLIFCVLAFLFLSDCNRQTYWGGWMRWGLELPSTLCLWRRTDSLTLLWTFRGVAEATREAGGQHSCSSQTMHCFAHSTERRQSSEAAHMSQHVL